MNEDYIFIPCPKIKGINQIEIGGLYKLSTNRSYYLTPENSYSTYTSIPVNEILLVLKKLKPNPLRSSNSYKVITTGGLVGYADLDFISLKKSIKCR